MILPSGLIRKKVRLLASDMRRGVFCPLADFGIAERDRFAQALPATTTVGRMITLRRKI